MKIVLAGGYDTKNLGDHGSLEVFQRDIRKLDPSSEIILLSRHPDRNFDKLYNVKSILNLDHSNKQESLGRWFNGLNANDDTTHLKRIIKELGSANLLVIGNGRLFVDISLDFMKGPLPYFVLLVTMAKFLGVPIMIFSMTIVPIKTDLGHSMIKYILSNSDAITVREEPSKQQAEAYGALPAKVFVISDAAFGLKKEDRIHQGKTILDLEEVVHNQKQFIAVNFRFTHLETSVSEDFYQTMANLCDYLYKHTGTEILMISQMTYDVDNALDDDREVYKRVYEKCTHKHNIHIIRGEYNIFETMSLYQNCEMVFSMRRHGLIFSATQDVPIFALSGEKNTSYVLKTLDIENSIIDIKSISTDYNYSQLIDNYMNRDDLRKKMKVKITELSKETERYAEIALSVAV